MLSFLGVILGIVLLIGGGTALVAGASQIATRLGVSPLVIGLTIVGFGTSAPELVINVMGSARGEVALAFGNVIGSNIANLALILGVATLIRPIDIQGSVVRREVPLLLLITSIIMVMALDGPLEAEPAWISRSDGVVLLLLFGIFIYITVQDLMHARRQDALLDDIEDNPIIVTQRKSRLHALWVLVGLALLFAGGEVTVTSAVSLAEILGVSSSLVGLFVVAVGTSMPELVTSIIAAMRKESDLAMGNLVGSNIFNSLIVLPAGCLVSPAPVPAGGLPDLLFSWLLTAMLIPVFFIGKACLGRTMGSVLLMSYFAYAAFRFTAF